MNDISLLTCKYSTLVTKSTCYTFYISKMVDAKFHTTSYVIAISKS